jgi:hypothetical protein
MIAMTEGAGPQSWISREPTAVRSVRLGEAKSGPVSDPGAGLQAAR